MKILLINNFHYRKGGSEAVYFNTAELLQKEGHEVLFFSMCRPQNLASEQAPYFVTCKETTGRPRLSGWKKIRNYFYNPEAKKRLEQLILHEKPDVAHVHLFWGGLSPSIFSVFRKYHIPLVHTAHDYRMVCPAYTFRDGKGRICEACKGTHFYRCAQHRCAKGSFAKSVLMAAEMYFRNFFFRPSSHLDGIIFVSRFSREKHLRYAPDFRNTATLVLYNAMPPLQAAQEKAWCDPDKAFRSYLLYYGRLSGEKGIRTLLEAVRALPDFSFKITGNGPLAGMVTAIKQKENLENLEITGYRTGYELYRLISGASFVIVPSECYENNPMTIVEAYTLQTPVIGARIGGIPEIIRAEETGFLFSPADATGLAAAIRQGMAADAEIYRRMCRTAWQFARQHFNEKDYCRRLSAFYTDLINDKK